jgi:polar amino acid transport system substrate-binding protein
MGQASVHDKPYRFRAAAIDRIVEVRMSAAGMLWLMLAMALVLLMPLNAIAQERENQTKQLVVGTKEAPPFAMKDEHGNWKGVSIDLWRHIAGRMGLQYRFAEAESVNSLLEGVRAGNFDVAVAAITVTPAREQQVDFTTPYFHSGTGIAVQADRISNWLPVIRSMASYSFLQAALALLGLTFLVGLLIWFFERRSNAAFAGGVAQGLSSGVWWSTNAMTQRALEGGVVPMTLPGRIVAVIWMVVSVIAIALFTAGITSALTTRRLHGAVNSLADLSSVRVATVQGTETEDALSRMRIKYRTVSSPIEGFDALQKGTIDALTYDRPILAWLIRQRGFSAELTDVTFSPQDYAIALRNDSSLRKQINVALLEAEETDWWKDILFRYLGQR